MKQEQLFKIVEDLFTRSEYRRCFYCDDGDCAPWKQCSELFPSCPIVLLAIEAGYPMTLEDDNGPDQA